MTGDSVGHLVSPAACEDAEWLCREMGGDLARRRRAAGLAQTELAALIGYSQAAVAHAETGRNDVGWGFWAAVDRLLGTGGFYTDAFYLVRETERKRTAVTPRPADLNADLMMKSALPEQAFAAYRRRGWPVTAPEGCMRLATGRTVEALEVGRVAGVIAAGAWQEAHAGEAIGRGSSRLPLSARSLAAIDAGDRWYFLIESGSCPWSGTRPVGSAPRTHIRWHSIGGSVPVPPAGAKWAHLPATGIFLPSPQAVLDLLAWATSGVTGPNTLTVRGGVTVAPAIRR